MATTGALPWPCSRWGAIVHDEGNARAALPVLEEATTLLQQIGDRGWLPGALAQLGLVELDLGDLSGAVSHMHEGLVLAAGSEARPGIGMALEGFACSLAAEGRGAQAARLAGAADVLRGVVRVRGPTPTLAWRRQVEWRLAALQRADPDDALDPRTNSTRQPPELDEAIHEALAVAAELALRGGSRKPGQARAADSLTAREHEVVTLVRQGLTSRQIADVLVVSERTVNTHLEHIRNKLGVRSRAQIVARTSDVS